MLFGGYQPFTLSDYPSTVAAIAFAQGCNFRCRFCHNGGLLPLAPAHGSALTSDDILRRLDNRRGKLDGLVVSGGEPTIQPDLPDFLACVKTLGFKVKLDTNGSRPAVLSDLLKRNLLDYVAMDVKASFEDYSRLCGVQVSTEAISESIKLISASGVPHHFRTTFGLSLMSDDDLAMLRSEIPACSKHVVQDFNPLHALDPELRRPAYAI